MNLEGKVALVLGAIKGIGKGITLALAQEGVKVAVTPKKPGAGDC